MGLLPLSTLVERGCVPQRRGTVKKQTHSHCGVWGLMVSSATQEWMLSSKDSARTRAGNTLALRPYLREVRRDESDRTY
jgi:cytochrome oxidase assembly protein ShyY1